MATVLVIDDELLPRETLVRLLNAGGYQTLEASNGRSGMQLATQHLPDLVISDIRMPAFTGFDVLKELRSNPQTSSIPLVFVSALNDIKAIREGMNEGADDYLGKPYSAQDLLRVVETQLKKRRLVEDKHDTSLRILRKNIIYALPHEFRTPLSLILGYAQILEDEYATVPRDELLQSAQIIVKSANRLQRVIENYLVYAQTEVIKADANEVEQLRNHILKDVFPVIEAVAKKKAEEHKRTDDLSLDLCHVALRISEANLKKIVEELVDNAFKFSPRGSKVLVKAVHDQNLFKLYFRDYGRGMTAEEIKSLGAYMQFNRAIFEQQGLGMGLAIAQRLIDLHNGKMHIESRVDQGTAVAVEMSIY